MTSTLIRHLFYWTAAAVGLAAAFLYYQFNPATVHFFPPCMFRKLTGLHCPGCGAQRALHQLMHGNIREAFRYNALLMLAIPYVSLGFVLDIWNQTKGFGYERMPAIYRRKEVIMGIAILICLFWIFRNIPIEPFSWLAPREG
ncbi:MAG: DUF2752 domain-containing protein [Siphonobacter sp.]